MDELTIREIFPKRLRYYMDEYRKTRNDLVHDLGFKYSTVRDWEKGITVPRMDKVEMLANYFHCSNADLLTEEEKPTAGDDGLSEKKKALIEFAESLSEEQAELALRLLKAAVGAD